MPLLPQLTNTAPAGQQPLWSWGKCMFTGKEKWPLAGSTCGVCHQEEFRTTDRSTGGVLFFSAFLLGDPLPAARAGIALFPSRGWLPASVTQGIIHHFTQAVWCLGSAGGGQGCPSRVAGRTMGRLVGGGQRGSLTANHQEQRGCVMNGAQMSGVRALAAPIRTENGDKET